ncbi:MAG: hypothetical protein HQL50_09235 [Magnetococcales bacterium]|nr:hypothetical protein [Magnetococcales bacterium]
MDSSTSMHLIVILLTIGCFFGLVIGLRLLVSGTGSDSLKRPAREVLEQLLFRPLHLERLFYRNHRVFGFVIVLGSLIALVGLFDHLQRMVQAVTFLEEQGMAWRGVGGLLAVLLLATGLTMIAGIVVFIRPSMLKPVENWAHQPVDSQSFVSRLLAGRRQLIRSVSQHPRFIGVILVISTLFILYRFIDFWQNEIF